MSAATLATAGAVGLLAGIAFLFVARAVSSRGATGERLLARRAHAAWWLSLGAYLVAQGAMTLLASADALPSSVYLASRVVAIPLVCLGAWGITFYLLFLYTGRTSAAAPLAVLYAGVVAMMLYATYGVEQTVTVHAWHVSVDDSMALYQVAYALVGLPPILASAAYLALLRRVSSREQRYRISLVAGSILAYVGSGLAARLLQDDAFIFVSLVVLGLGAAFASLAAYYPPAPVRAWLGRGPPSEAPA